MAFTSLVDTILQDSRVDSTVIYDYNGHITKAFKDVELKLFYYEMAKE